MVLLVGDDPPVPCLGDASAAGGESPPADSPTNSVDAADCGQRTRFHSAVPDDPVVQAAVVGSCEDSSSSSDAVSASDKPCASAAATGSSDECLKTQNSSEKEMVSNAIIASSVNSSSLVPVEDSSVLPSSTQDAPQTVYSSAASSPLCSATPPSFTFDSSKDDSSAAGGSPGQQQFSPSPSKSSAGGGGGPASPEVAKHKPRGKASTVGTTGGSTKNPSSPPTAVNSGSGQNAKAKRQQQSGGAASDAQSNSPSTVPPSSTSASSPPSASTQKQTVPHAGLLPPSASGTARTRQYSPRQSTSPPSTKPQHSPRQTNESFDSTSRPHSSSFSSTGSGNRKGPVGSGSACRPPSQSGPANNRLGTAAPHPNSPSPPPGQRGATPQQPQNEPLHPLQSTWCLWTLVDRQSAEVPWREKMKEVHDFWSVEGFWSMQHNIHTPSSLGLGDYYLFRKGVAPDWNDHAFQHGGGRILVQFPSRYKLLDEIWLNVSLLMIGEGYDDTPDSPKSVCGAVAACRSKLTKIALWISTSELNKVYEIGQRFVDFVTGLTTNANSSVEKPDIKPEFESFRKGTSLDMLFHMNQEKTVIPWADLRKSFPNGQRGTS